jgi:hypothetical protein
MMRRPWRSDVLEALEELGGEAHLQEIYPIVKRRREQRGDTLGQYEAWIRYELNHNCNGRGNNIYERVARGVYKKSDKNL